MGELVPLETLKGMRRRRRRRNIRVVAGDVAAVALLISGITGGMIAANSGKANIALVWFAGTLVAPPVTRRLIAGRDSK